MRRGGSPAAGADLETEVLAWVELDGPCSVQRVSRGTGFTPTAVVTCLAQLEKRGLVQRESDGVTHWSLT